MKLLVLTEDYPSENSKMLMYVHTRNLYYAQKEISVVVLNFRAKENYIIDGIQVITLEEYKNNTDKYNCDILISHAPNLKHHYRFLKKHEKNFKNIVFFFHGHEIVKINKVYPKPYNYMKQIPIKRVIRDVYDNIKLRVWKSCFTKIANKSHFIFVSNFLYNEFLNGVRIDRSKIENKKYIINNCVGKIFEKKAYKFKENKKYDFITIRNNMDESCYSIDIVNKLAKKNPDNTFLVIGKGKYFEYNTKANNIIWINEVLEHSKIIEFLSKSRCALMPTKRDTQGLMACEMVTFGIPLITSDIPICHEIFDSFKNVEFIDNDNIENNDLKELYKRINEETGKNDKYFYKNTCEKEINILGEIYGRTNEKK